MMNAVNADGRYSASITQQYGQTDHWLRHGTEPADGVTNPGCDHCHQRGRSQLDRIWRHERCWATKIFSIQASGAAAPTTFVDEGNLTVGALMSDIQAMGLSATLNGNGQLVVGDPNNQNNAPVITRPR